ncbi:hypothetical protein L6164_002588 [Bauhinia variegata]|uniref:Uncharacterized protein n=1 Tax=Bauhinia variegata TaxID=167791 RepID=A0ACB9Q1D3_BAUVA|nr:hypothetical protein L6164_002588 [Bauhinia variegata]
MAPLAWFLVALPSFGATTPTHRHHGTMCILSGYVWCHGPSNLVLWRQLDVLSSFDPFSLATCVSCHSLSLSNLQFNLDLIPLARNPLESLLYTNFLALLFHVLASYNISN